MLPHIKLTDDQTFITNDKDDIDYTENRNKETN